MPYTWISPGLQLAGLVSQFWQLDNATILPETFTVLPDGECELVLTLRPGHAPQVSLFGVGTVPLVLSLAPRTTWLGVRFPLLAADYLFPGLLPLNGQRDLPADL